MNKGDRTN